MMNAKESNIFSRISSFSVILIVLVLVVIGAGIMPLLNVQYTPSGEQQGVSVNYSWNNASARVIEAEVTSKIEGLLMSIQGVAHVNSVTYQGGGRVDVLFKKHVNVDAIRFEIASQMRHLYPKLPEGVSYPALSAASSCRFPASSCPRSRTCALSAAAAASSRQAQQRSFSWAAWCCLSSAPTAPSSSLCAADWRAAAAYSSASWVQRIPHH